MNFKSLKQQLIVVLLLTSIIPVIMTFFAMFWAIDKSLTHVMNTQQADMELAVETQIEKVSSDLLALAINYAEYPDVKAATKETELERLHNISPIYERLALEHELTVFELGTIHGYVHYRAHRPENRGDDKSAMLAIQQALDGESSTGFEFGSSGLAARAFAPIMDGSEVIGTLQIGTNNSFLKDLSDMFPSVTVSLLNEGGMVTRSSNEELVNQSLKKGVNFEQVLEGKLQRVDKSNSLQSYIPMYDPTGTKIIGAIHLTKDTSIINTIFDMLLILAGIILVVTAIAAVIIASFYTKGLTKPLVAVVERMAYLRKGDLTLPIEPTNRKDEIGQLTRSANEMQQQLQQSLQSVANASYNVSEKGNMLTESAKEVQRGSQHIVETMEVVSIGAEKQTKSVSEVSEYMATFAMGLHDTNEKGTHLQEVSEQVTQLSLSGSTMIQQSNQQMTELHDVMQDAVHKMKTLDTQTAEVSRFVAIIEDVANQTNLLALNASIEAARAGEHGKGFAVVADEVRKLASQVADSVSEITSIVDAVQRETKGVAQSLQLGFGQVAEGSAQMQQTTGTFQQITASVEMMQQSIIQVIEMMHKMATEGQEISASLQEISAITEETSANIEETTATTTESNYAIANVAKEAEELLQLADDLNEIVKQYKL